MPPKSCVKKTGRDKVVRCGPSDKKDSIFDEDCEVSPKGRCRKVKKQTEKAKTEKVKVKDVKKVEKIEGVEKGQSVKTEKVKVKDVEKVDKVEKVEKVEQTEGKIIKGGFVSWNVAGIRACIRKGNLTDFIKQYSPDVLCLQEVKASVAQVAKDEPEGWKLLTETYPHYVWADSTAKKGYAGVALFSKGPFLQSVIGLGESDHDKYGRIITVEYPEFYLVTSYVPNSGSGLKNIKYRSTEWNPAFQNWILRLQGEGMGEGGKGKEVIVCGDLNVAHTKWDLKNDRPNWNKRPGYTEAECNGMNSLLESTGLIDSFRVKKWSGVDPETKGNYSFWSNFGNARANNSGWRIDYFLVHGKGKVFGKVSQADILSRVYGSDHCPVRLLF